MKRSDALKKIQDLYKLELDQYPKHNPPDIFAENLLAWLEDDIGMEPPYDPTSDDEDPIHEWEPEDE